MFGPKTLALQKRAQEIIPLGVNSNFRFWGERITPYVEKAKGAYLWDVDGKKYIDYRMAFGPIILGHSYAEVDQKVIAEIQKGILFAMTGELEVALAEMVTEMAPAVEMVRLACSGTEATMHAIRVARAYTGRDLILKFEGNYHGFHDHTLWSTYAPVEAYGNRRSPIPVPSSSGIPKSMREFIITLPFNDFEGFERVMRSYGEQIAAVISEPCQGNCAAINPQDGFLELIRKKTEEHGCVFILDEVKTGFRIANGGAQEYYGIQPDLATYAKALGNGFPCAALITSPKVSAAIKLDSLGTTYGGGPMACAAIEACIEAIESENLLANVRKMSEYIRKTCMVGPVTGVQGEGFLLGLRTTRPAKEIHAQLLEVGILAGTSTDPNILRLLPPFILEEQHVDMLADALSHLP